MSSRPTPFRLLRSAEVAELILDHPPLNLFDEAVFESLRDTVAELEGEPPRGLLVRAEGTVGSAGVDVRLFQGLQASAAESLWAELIEIVQRIEALSFPTVFAAHGLTLTALFEIALACDLVLAARSARFGLVETAVGLTPSMGGPQRLAERAGPSRAKDLIFSGELFDADTMVAWGVVARVWEDADFLDSARAFLGRLASGPTLAHDVTKQLVTMATREGLAAADDAVPRLCSALFETRDAQAAITLFLERGPGKARFRGA